MTIGFVNAIYLNCYGMEKERNSTWYVTYQLPGCWEKFKVKASVVQLLSHFQIISEQLGQSLES